MDQEGYYIRTLVMVVTAVLKAVSLTGGHTVATELPSMSSDTSMGFKQSISLTLAMYGCMYVRMYVSMYVGCTQPSIPPGSVQ